MFEKTYTNFNRIRKFSNTSDGGFIVAGQSSSLGNPDMAMMKLDANGDVEWVQAYGNSSATDAGEAAAQTLDGGYILVGYSGPDCYTVKTNSLGVVQWQKTHTPSQSMIAFDVLPLADSSYIISTGSISSGTMTSPAAAGFMQLDKAGNVTWAKSYISSSFACCTYNPKMYRVMKFNNSSSMLALGSMASSNNTFGFFLKFNAAGTIMSQKYETASLRFYDGVQTSDNNIVLVGNGKAGNSGIMMKVDTSGNAIWTKLFPSATPAPLFQNIVELPGGDLLIYGYTYNGESFLMQTNSLGVIQRTRKLGNFTNTTFSVEDNASIRLTQDGAYLVARDNRVKKVPLDITQSCTTNAISVSNTAHNSTIFNDPQTIRTSYDSNVKTFITGSVTSSATTVCSSTYCAAPAQPSAISGTTTICSGTSLTYSVPAVSGASAYTWSLPGTWSGTSTSNSITVTVGASGGTLSVSAMNACTSSSPSTLAVTVNPSAAVPGTVSGSVTPCSGTSATYSVAPVSGASSYSWALPGGWTGSSTTNSISATVGTAGGNVSVSSINNCGTSAAQTLSVTVDRIPLQPAGISGNATTCAGSVETYSIAPLSDATSYSWTVPGGWTGSSTTNSISVTAGTSGGNISVTAINHCGTSPGQVQALTISSLPATPGAVSGNTLMCPSASAIYTIAPVSGATSYNWSLPGGWSGSNTSNTINVTAGTAAGTMSVAAVNACGQSSFQTFAVAMGSLPSTPLSISGATVFCPGGSLTYSVAAVSGVTSYNWSLPSGWSGSSTTNVINATAGSSAGSLSVTAINHCGASPAQVLALSHGPAPSMPLSISGATVFCPGESLSYSVAPVSGATSYNWSLPGAWSGSSTNNTISVTAGTSAGTMSVTASSACGSSAPQSMAVVIGSAPMMPAAISGSTTLCSGTSATYSVPLVAGANAYAWTLPSGWSGTGTSNTISVVAGASSGTIQVVSINGCGSSAAQEQSVTVGLIPSVPAAISGNASPCIASTGIYSVSAVSGATSYSWILPSGFSGTSSSNIIAATAGGVGGAIQVAAVNHCGSSLAQSLAVLVSALPAVQAGSSHALICAGETATLTANGANTYAWNTGASTSSITVSPSVTTSYTVTGTSLAGCVNTAVLSQSVSLCTGIEETTIGTITVYPNPTKGLVTVETAHSLRMVITNVFGQEIRIMELSEGQHNIDLQAEPGGIYFIHLFVKNESRVFKLIKE